MQSPHGETLEPAISTTACINNTLIPGKETLFYSKCIYTTPIDSYSNISIELLPQINTLTF